MRGFEAEDIRKRLNQLQWQLEHKVSPGETVADELARLELELLTYQQRYQRLFELAPAGYFYLDQNGLIQDVNEQGLVLLGATSRWQMINASFARFVSEPHLDLYYRHKRNTAPSSDEVLVSELLLRRREGVELLVQLQSKPMVEVAESGGLKRGVLLMAFDLSERQTLEHSLREHQAHLQSLAYRDALTGMANRRALKEHLSQWLGEQEASASTRIAAIYLDLDGFKLVNDSLGHHYGDRLLSIIATRLQHCVRRGDLVARLGGDEFCLVVRYFPGRLDLGALAQNIVDRVASPIHVDERELAVTASVGISVYPSDCADAERLIHNADVAMGESKRHGKNCYRFFQTAQQVHASQSMNLNSQLRRALDRGEFRLHYQPQVNLLSGRIVGMEALLRWQHPERGLVLPGEFLNQAEASGLIVPIGEWALRAACEQMSQWRAQGLDWLSLAVNVSPLQCRSEGFRDFIHGIFDGNRELGAHMELELTEHTLLEGAELYGDLFRDIQALGPTLTIDDFGTGYSSLKYIREFPVNKLKIDQSFIQGLPDSASDRAIVAAVIAMAREIGIKVVAEGVESPEQHRFLLEHRCPEYQGYLFSRPLTAEAMTAMLQSE